MGSPDALLAGPQQTARTPDTVEVICGDATGLFFVKKAKVFYEGREISPTEFERAGGRGSSKKWKTSLRVLKADRRSGECIMDWLEKHGLLTRKVQPPRTGGSPLTQEAQTPAQLQTMPPQAQARAATPQYFNAATQQPVSLQPPPKAACAPQPTLAHSASMPPSAQQWRSPLQQPQPQQAQWQPQAQPSAAALANLGVMPAQVKVEVVKPMPRPLAAAQRPAGQPPLLSKAIAQGPPPLDLIGHLQRQYVGLIPGDPTMESLPEELPEAAENLSDGHQSDITVVDLGSASYAALMEMSRASAEAPLSQLLPEPPGILPEREAHLTGHRPAKRPRPAPAEAKTEAVDKHEAGVLLGEYMAGNIDEAPWEAFGLSKQPVIGGRPLDLRHFYAAVQEQGGFDAAVAKKRWVRIAKKLGIDVASITNAGWVLRNSYTKYLLAYEIQARAYAAMPQQSATQERHASEATSQSASARNDSSAAATPEAAMAGSLQGEAQAVSSAVPHGCTNRDTGLQPPQQPDQAKEDGIAGLAAEQPQRVDVADGPDHDSTAALGTEQGLAHAGTEESAPCLAGASRDAEPPPPQGIGVKHASSEAERPHLEDEPAKNSTPCETQSLLEGGSGSQAPATSSAEAMHEGVAGRLEAKSEGVEGKATPSVAV